jgi:hypothetical protein
MHSEMQPPTNHLDDLRSNVTFERFTTSVARWRWRTTGVQRVHEEAVRDCAYWCVYTNVPRHLPCKMVSEGGELFTRCLCRWNDTRHGFDCEARKAGAFLAYVMQLLTGRALSTLSRSLTWSKHGQEELNASAITLRAPSRSVCVRL